MVEESEGIFDDGFGAQGHVAAQAQLGPPDEFQDEQIIQKGPGPLDDGFGNGPGVVAFVDGLADDAFGHVNGFAGVADVEGLVGANAVKDEEVFAGDEGDGDVVF